MKDKTSVSYSTSLGMLTITADNDAVTEIRLVPTGTEAKTTGEQTPLIREAYRQVSEYLAGERTAFTFPVCPEGTPFQKKVWEALRAIPYGERQSYGEVAAAIGQPKAARAVGGACHCNPVLLAIPCHRVVQADGTLGGFGCGTAVKQLLLSLEKSMLAKHSS